MREGGSVTRHEVDARLAEAFRLESPPDTTRVEQVVWRRISSARVRRRWTLASAVAAMVIAAISGIYRMTSTPRVYADAARDHWVEVVQRQPRHWRIGAPEIQTLTAQNGLSFAEAAGLAPPHYRLELAKICGLDGHRLLHLVFTDGEHKYSLYLRRHEGVRSGVRIVQRDSEQVAGFETGRFSAFVVTVGAAGDCEDLARLIAARL
jgi:hypothetical protein